MEARVDHFQPEVALASVAERAHPLTDRERFLLTGIEVEEAQYEFRVAILEQAHELPARPVLNVGVDDSAFDLPGAARLHGSKGANVGAILVAQRQVQHEVLLARDAEPSELFLERMTRF